jgi:H+/Cl- antiporter ClcA
VSKVEVNISSKSIFLRYFSFLMGNYEVRGFVTKFSLKWSYLKVMIISDLNKSLGMLFLIACFVALINPPPYLLIGLIFLLMGLVVLPSNARFTEQKFDWKIKGGTKATIVLACFCLICLIVPQVNLETSSFTINYSEQEVNGSKS